jgi:hypothetical protein
MAPLRVDQSEFNENVAGYPRLGFLPYAVEGRKNK